MMNNVNAFMVLKEQCYDEKLARVNELMERCKSEPTLDNLIELKSLMDEVEALQTALLKLAEGF